LLAVRGFDFIVCFIDYSFSDTQQLGEE